MKTALFLFQLHCFPPDNDAQALPMVQITAWRLTDRRPLSELMTAYICVTPHRWDKPPKHPFSNAIEHIPSSAVIMRSMQVIVASYCMYLFLNRSNVLHIQNPSYVISVYHIQNVLPWTLICFCIVHFLHRTINLSLI